MSENQLNRSMHDLQSPEFTPELRLAVACACWPLADEGRQEIRLRAAAGLDWDRFLAWVARHGVVPLVYQNLRESAPSSMPDAVLGQLHDWTMTSARRALVQIGEAARITRLLGNAGIRSMMLKGPVLSLLAYGDATLRASRDIDLLVDPGQVREAERLIGEAGYRRFDPNFELTPRQHQVFQRVRCQFAYFSEKTAVVQELHWRLSSNPTLLPLDEQALWSRPDHVHLQGIDFITLPDEELFLYLCVHAAVHVWFRLKWLADIAALLRRMPPGALVDVERRADSLGVARPFHQALLLAHSLVGAPVPAQILTRAALDKAALGSAKAARRALSWKGSPSEPAETRWFNAWVGLQAYRLRPELAYRWAEWQDQLCSPEDWARMPLPEWLFFLYAPLRPFSWAVRKLKKVLIRSLPRAAKP
jgi:hypothetical protein